MLASPSQTENRIQIVIADDHSIFREGLAGMLNKYDNVQLIGQAENGKELISLVEEKKPQVVITDIEMPVLNGLEATRIIRKKVPETEVIVLSMYSDESLIVDIMEAGAKGYLLKNANKTEVITAIETVHAKGSHYCSVASNKVVQLMAKSGFNPFRPGKKAHFTDKELEIIRLMCQEYSSKEIASALNISCRCVEGSRERIQEKIGAKNMVGVTIYAIRHGIFSVN